MKEMNEARKVVMKSGTRPVEVEEGFNMNVSYIGVGHFLSRAEEYYFELHKREITSRLSADAQFVKESFEKIPSMLRNVDSIGGSASNEELDDFREDFFKKYFEQNPDIDAVYIVDDIAGYESMQIRPELKEGFCQNLFDFSYDEEYTSRGFQDALG